MEDQTLCQIPPRNRIGKNRSGYGTGARDTFGVVSTGVESDASSAVASSKFTEVGFVGVSAGRWSPTIGGAKSPNFSSFFLRRSPWLRGPGFGFLLNGTLIPPYTRHAIQQN